MVSSHRGKDSSKGGIMVAKFDLGSSNWREMISNLNATLELYRSSDRRQRNDIRGVLEAAISEIVPHGSEDVSLAYLLGRLDEMDESR